MNLEGRIKKLEVAVAALPEINHEHINALARFLETGSVDVLPNEGVDRSETLLVARSIPIEDADAYPGLAVIADAMTADRLSDDVHLTTATPAAALAALHRLGPADTPFPWIFYDPDFAGLGHGASQPGPGHRLLAGLGLIQLLRVVYRKPEPILPKTNCS